MKHCHSNEESVIKEMHETKEVVSEEISLDKFLAIVGGGTMNSIIPESTEETISVDIDPLQIGNLELSEYLITTSRDRKELIEKETAGIVTLKGDDLVLTEENISEIVWEKEDEAFWRTIPKRIDFEDKLMEIDPDFPKYFIDRLFKGKLIPGFWTPFEKKDDQAISLDKSILSNFPIYTRDSQFETTKKAFLEGKVKKKCVDFFEQEGKYNFIYLSNVLEHVEYQCLESGVHNLLGKMEQESLSLVLSGGASPGIVQLKKCPTHQQIKQEMLKQTLEKNFLVHLYDSKPKYKSQSKSSCEEWHPLSYKMFVISKGISKEVFHELPFLKKIN